MKGIGFILIILGVLAYLFTGNIEGFEGKNGIIGIVLVVLGLLAIAIDLYQARPRNQRVTRSTITDDGTGRPVAHEENTDIRRD